jgi:hypothetical protein
VPGNAESEPLVNDFQITVRELKAAYDDVEKMIQRAEAGHRSGSPEQNRRRAENDVRQDSPGLFYLWALWMTR